MSSACVHSHIKSPGLSQSQGPGGRAQLQFWKAKPRPTGPKLGLTGQSRAGTSLASVGSIGEISSGNLLPYKAGTGGGGRGPLSLRPKYKVIYNLEFLHNPCIPLFQWASLIGLWRTMSTMACSSQPDPLFLQI